SADRLDGQHGARTGRSARGAPARVRDVHHRAHVPPALASRPSGPGGGHGGAGGTRAGPAARGGRRRPRPPARRAVPRGGGRGTRRSHGTSCTSSPGASGSRSSAGPGTLPCWRTGTGSTWFERKVRHMLMQQLLYDGAHRTPDRPAFHWVERDRTLTYAEAV